MGQLPEFFTYLKKENFKITLKKLSIKLEVSLYIIITFATSGEISKNVKALTKKPVKTLHTNSLTMTLIAFELTRGRFISLKPVQYKSTIASKYTWYGFYVIPIPRSVLIKRADRPVVINLLIPSGIIIWKEFALS